MNEKNNKISLDIPKEPGPYWSNVLSDADQQCLGLAFFLAQAEAQGSQILVFDDPTVGLDNERFAAFCECLDDLQDQVEQIIIFSHQELDFSAFEPVVFELKAKWFKFIPANSIRLSATSLAFIPVLY